MQKISEAVVDKVREEAQSIVSEAEEEAKKELDKAKSQRNARIEAEKRRLLNEAHGEAARVSAQNAMLAHRKVATAKAEVLESIVAKSREKIGKAPVTRESLAYLITDAIPGLGNAGKVTVAVSKRDLGLAKDIVKSDKQLSEKVLDVVSCDCDGGAIIESESNTLSVDNTYTTRLEMLLPRILPEISRELF
jgi:vacuolar-type H+-ATPase subunit E/Vma4